MEGDHRESNHISPQRESQENKAAATNTPDTESEETVSNKQTAEEKPANEAEACNESGEEEVIDEQPLGWDAGAEQAKEIEWGDLPPTNTQTQTASDNGASSWTNSNEQTEEKVGLVELSSVGPQAKSLKSLKVGCCVKCGRKSVFVKHEDE
uniref:C2H2-type domain-containing protein n=1 Tax=Ascaris lumbricoides TaxID=6252 RepID=A0A0M3IGL6_ASCLU